MSRSQHCANYDQDLPPAQRTYETAMHSFSSPVTLANKLVTPACVMPVSALVLDVTLSQDTEFMKKSFLLFSLSWWDLRHIPFFIWVDSAKYNPRPYDVASVQSVFQVALSISLPPQTKLYPSADIIAEPEPYPIGKSCKNVGERQRTRQWNNTVGRKLRKADGDSSIMNGDKAFSTRLLAC